MHAFVRSVRELIERDEIFVMATVAESSGSTPRSSGAKMIVREDGSIFGSVGGGLVEAMSCEAARTMLLNEEKDGSAQMLHVNMTQELAASSDMICGGNLSVLLEVVTPNGQCAEAYGKLDSLLRLGNRMILSTRLEGTDALRAMTHTISHAQTPDGSPSLEREDDGMWLMEPVHPPAPLYLFGAGHVSQFTARVAAMIGFRTIVLDDREEYANRERFPEVDEVKVLPSFQGCCDGLDIDGDAFIVILTRGHQHDRTVLAEALGTKAGYVGMIGSRKKRNAIYASLSAEGFSQQDIDRCHCPIGLPIGGRTPEEIAVSIAAELIQVRAGRGA